MHSQTELQWKFTIKKWTSEEYELVCVSLAEHALYA